MIAKTGEAMMDTTESPETIGIAALRCSASGGWVASTPVPPAVVSRHRDGGASSAGHPRIPTLGAPAPWR
jgi:hypothetical protein